MKSQKVFEGSVQGNLDGYSIEMDLDLSPEGRAHLLSLMTDLYSDPAMAVLREYSTNALDSHIEAGVTRPIEVVLPTALSPYLVIRDFGVGLSLSDMENVYSKYGASTKRGSNDVNGMLGLGGKSALTLTSQFTVTSVKGGVRYQVVVTRNEDGIGTMEVVDTAGTDLPNGVEIRVPSSGHDFRDKASHLFYFWKPGTVLVNGQQPDNIFTADHVKIGDNVYVRDVNYRYGGANDIIVMGNVPYEMRDAALSAVTADSSGYKQTIAFVEMGDVMFAPSREALAYTPRTIATIERLVSEIKANIESSVAKEFNTIKSYADAFRVWRKWVGVVGIKALPNIKYNGHEFFNTASCKGYKFGIEQGRYNYRASTYSDSVAEAKMVNLSEIIAKDALIVEGYTNTSTPSITNRNKIKAYLAANNLSHKTIWLFDKMPGSPWTSEVQTVQWDVISSIKLNSSQVGGPRGPIPILIYRNGNWKNETITIDQSERVLLVSPREDISRYVYNRIVGAFPGTQIIQLGANRWEKFTRESAPHAMGLMRFYNGGEFSKALAESLTDDEKAAGNLGDKDRAFGRHMKGQTFDDPRLNEIVRLSAIDNARVNLYNESINNGRGTTNYIKANYPLWPEYGEPNKKHFVLYANAAYAQKGK